MVTYQGRTALVTGASSGIGEAFARALAARGMAVVLVARSEGRLRSLAEELAGRHQVRAEVIAADLSQEGAAQRLQEEVVRRGLRVDLLVNNAGFATHGSFGEQASEREHAEVMLNVVAVVDLVHAFLPAMLERGEGTVINVASNTAFQPVPYMAVYGASKAFVLSFSEALAEEYRGRGVRVLALCPGRTATAFFANLGPDAPVGRARTPAQVVTTALWALEQGRTVIVDGLRNALVAQAPRLVPRRIAAKVAGWSVRPRDRTP